MKRNISLNLVNPDHKPAGLIVTGHWVTRPGYGTKRQFGTQDWLIIGTLSGNGRITYEGGSLQLCPGDLALWFPGTFHDYRIDKNCDGWEILWAHFMARPHWHEFMNWPQKGNGPRVLAISDRSLRQQVFKNLQSMHAYATGPLERGKLLALNALEKALLLSDLMNPGTSQARMDPRIRSALDILCRNPAHPVSLATVAKECGLSLSRFAHLFKDHLGLTPLEYREQQQMLQARRLLESTTFSIKEIAAMTGFESPFYFSRRFSKQTGSSPSGYRKKALAG